MVASGPVVQRYRGSLGALTQGLGPECKGGGIWEQRRRLFVRAEVLGGAWAGTERLLSSPMEVC